MKVYLVRHGESEGNLTQTHQQDSTPLSFEGMRQADKLAARFGGVKIDKILSSPLMRTRQTAEAIAKETGAEIEFETQIREVQTPSIVKGRSHREPEIRAVWKQISKHEHDPSYHHSDEENFFDLKKRLAKFLLQLEKRPEKSLILVSHSGAIGCLIALMIFGDELTPQQFYRMRHHTLITNTGITVCDYETEWRIITINDAAHLLD